MGIKDNTAVVGIGRTKYFKRGQSYPLTQDEMAIHAIMTAIEDAGLSKDDVDGFGLYSAPVDPAKIGAEMGLKNLRFAATLTSGGGGAAGSIGLAAAAVHAGLANYVVSLMTLQQLNRRLGGTQVAPSDPEAAAAMAAMMASMRSPSTAFSSPATISSPGHNFAMITNRHMAQYGTKREHFAQQCINQRNNAIRRPTSIFRDPLTTDDYFNARMISEPLCLFDYTPETDGAVALITTTAERAKDLRQPPAIIAGSANGGTGKHYSLLGSFQMPDESFASSGHRDVAKQVYKMAGIGPEDVDVALLYDHFSPMVLMQIEDYGFCPIGESGPFVADGNTVWPGGKIPVNTHGGNLSEAYVIGMTHAYEAVEQVRGTAVNQVEDCEYALFTGGPATIPMSATILEEGLMTVTKPSAKPFKNMPPPNLTDPYADSRTQPFWDAAKNEQLLAPKCAKCATFRMPPSTFCPNCLSRELEWEPLSGMGTVYTFIIVRHPLNPNAADYVPFMPAAIDADGAPGMRFISNVVGCEPEDVKVGMRVKVVWNRVSDTLTLPFWAPA